RPRARHDPAAVRRGHRGARPGRMAEAVLASDTSLRAALDAWYAATEDARPAAAPVGCPCCVTVAESAALVVVARRALDEEQLGRYATKAMTTWGDERDFRWFAPRIAELVAADGCGAASVESLADKLVRAGWRTWGDTCV